MQFNKIALAKAINTLRAIKHPLRQKMMDAIQGKKSMNVTEMVNEFEMEQSVVSQQLAILRSAGVVDTKRQGKQIFYSVNTKRVSEIDNLIKQF